MTTSHNYHHQLQSCINLAYEAGKIALQFCKENIVNRSQTLDVELKLDKSPVTIVDKQINDFLVTKLTELFPKVRVVGEESKLQTEVKDYGEGSVFFVDPIDGTEEFIKNNGEWAVQIGLSENGKAKMGIVYQPEKDWMFYAIENQGAWKIEKKGEKPKKIQVIDRDIQDCIAVSSRSHYDDNIRKVLDAAGIKSEYRCGSFGVKCCQIAEGKANVYVNLRGRSSYWDSCGPSVIVREAGGLLIDENGKDVVYTGTSCTHKNAIIVCTKKAAEKLIAAVRSV